MRLRIAHVTRYGYAPAAHRLALRMRLWPSRFETQRPGAWRVSVNGEDVPTLFTDVHGEALGLWHAHAPVPEVEIRAEGEVETEDAAGVVRGLGRPRALGVFLRETPLTAPDDALRDLAEGARTEAGGGGPLEVLHALMDAVHGALDFRAGVTDASTPAARALALGAGVCQDHCHLFLAAARSLGAPARYVAGYLLAGEGDDALHETHAWAEAHVEGLGWVGFDPSSDMCPTERYVRVCSGLDARGATPIRGSVTGATEETLSAHVEIAAAAAAQQ